MKIKNCPLDMQFSSFQVTLKDVWMF